ncbi:cation:proton antiporter [Sediminibacterium soli]|uniref:sodium:proton antiporter n=1 Tax=Sediminibacterium soli TaxID=2698829 RepID=UPI00137B6C6A|nr:sodium:proton antiporter [Sediminibacterium soli]NCI46525.1 sodium:proton antiporter [Sediminibacterium soli]
MTASIIITICVLLLIAYIFDLTSGKTKIPAVILLLLLGWLARRISEWLELRIPDLTTLLPVFGTIGLILIVLEGSLELELNASKTKLIRKSFIVSLVPMLVLAFGLAYAFQLYGQPDFRQNLINAIPLCVISSAIAIPSVKNLGSGDKEFIIYESSLSDILGVLFFNFVVINESINFYSVTGFAWDIIVIVIVSFIATIGLAVLLNRIDHHIKFAPIILLVILIYELSKIFHLPGLIFILLFGLFLGNLDELKRFAWIRKLHPEKLNEEVHRFKYLTLEATFLVRSIFFILFGYLIEIAEIINPDTLGWAAGVVIAIVSLRAMLLTLNRLPLFPLLFVAPRGLITILLFFAIEPVNRIPLMNRSFIIQVIIFMAFLMMIGMMRKSPKRFTQP